MIDIQTQTLAHHQQNRKFIKLALMLCTDESSTQTTESPLSISSYRLTVKQSST